jgi:hypothetical protein
VNSGPNMVKSKSFVGVTVPACFRCQSPPQQATI